MDVNNNNSQQSLDALRAAMNQQNGAAQPTPAPQQQVSQPIRMSQGSGYNPSNQAGGQNTQQVTNQPTNNNNGSNAGEKKPMFSMKQIAIMGGAALVLILLIVIIGGLTKGGSGGKDVIAENPVESSEPEILIYEEPDIPFYDSAQIEKLRIMGYTADDIEAYEELAIPFEELVAEAEAKRQAWLDEAILPLYDTASDEYKQNMSSTWIPLPVRTDMQDWAEIGSYYEMTRNLDYEKVEVHGDQLFIKIYTDDVDHESYFFHLCTPEEWLALNDRGNVIATWTYCTPCVMLDGFLQEDPERSFICSTSIQIIQ